MCSSGTVLRLRLGAKHTCCSCFVWAAAVGLAPVLTERPFITCECDDAAGDSEAGWVDRDDPAWVDSVPSPKYEWDAGVEPLPTTGNWGEWNSYIASDPEFPIGGEGVPFRVDDDDDLFLGIADEEVSCNGTGPQ